MAKRQAKHYLSNIQWLQLPSGDRQQLLQLDASEASNGLFLPSGLQGTPIVIKHSVVCALSQESGHTSLHAPAYHTRPPKLIRKPTCPSQVKMGILVQSSLLEPEIRSWM